MVYLTNSLKKTIKTFYHTKKVQLNKNEFYINFFIYKTILTLSVLQSIRM